MRNGVNEKKAEKFEFFIADSRELLDDAESKLIAMEKNTVLFGKDREEILYAVFRIFHTLKGSASLLDLTTIVKLTHEAETMLDAFYKKQAVVSEEHLDILIRTTDFVRNILDKVEQQSGGEEGYEAGSTMLITELQKAVASIS